MTDSSWDDILPPLATSQVVPDVYDPHEYIEHPLPQTERTAAERTRTAVNQATELVQLARAKYDVVRGSDGKTYAVHHSSPGIAFGLRGTGGLRQQLASAYYNEKTRAASSGALGDAVAVLEGDALRAPESPIHLRVGRYQAGVIVDRATPSGAAVEVTARGWRELETSPILFRRTPVSLGMPTPEAGGNALPSLAALLNVDARGFHLIVAFMVAAFMPDIAHPILALTGQQGTAKTTAARLVLSIIDPSAASLQSQPRTPEDWAVAAYNVYGVGLDNVSSMAAWLQDALCKAVTGDAFVRRELYSDDSISVLRYRRPIVITAIDPGALQGDVADRLLPIELQPISPRERRTEAELQAEIDRLRPQVLGDLFDLLSAVLRTLPDTTLSEKPRMADFALVLAALDSATGWTTLPDYLAASLHAAQDVLDGDSFATAVTSMVVAQGRWEGTCLQLLGMFTQESTPRDWPRTPRAVAARLTRLTPALSAADVTVIRKTERSSHGAVYVLKHDLAATCIACSAELSATLAAAGHTTHPTCNTPLDEVPF